MSKDPPWYRYDKEPEHAFAAFEHWLRMPRPRKVDKVYNPGTGLRYPLTTTHNWSRIWDWRKRAAAYDQAISDALDADRVELMKAQQREALAGHAEMLSLSREATTNELRKLVERTRRDGTVEQLKPSEIVSAMTKTIELERLMVGESTSRPEVKGSINLSKLSDEDLIKLREISEKAAEGDE